MITKAIIVGKSTTAENKYLVRIPVLESAGNSNQISISTNEPLYEAALSYTPGNLNGFVAGDIVYVGFEDNRLDGIIILGKLWLGSEENLTNNLQGTSLYINGSTTLDGDVTINGVTLSTVTKNRQAINNLNDISEDLQGQVKKNTDAIEEINTKKIKFSNWIIEESGDNLNIYKVFDREGK